MKINYCIFYVISLANNNKNFAYEENFIFMTCICVEAGVSSRVIVNCDTISVSDLSYTVTGNDNLHIQCSPCIACKPVTIVKLEK